MVGSQSRALGDTAKMAVGAVVVLVLLVALAFLGGLLGVPAVESVDNRFGAVNDSTTEIETDMGLRNPNPLGAQFLGLSANYSVRMNGIHMASGEEADIDIPSGTSTLSTRTYMDNERIPPWWESHVRNGERTNLYIDASIRSSTLGRSFALPQNRTIETNVIGQFNSEETRPINASRPVVEDPVLYVNRTTAEWGTVSDGRTPIDMTFDFYNPKPAPYVLTGIRYTITMNDVVVGNGTTEEPTTLPPGTVTTVGTPTTIRTDSLDEWWVSHLENDQVTQLRIEFEATVELPTGTTITVPLRELTYEKTIETDIFGNEENTTSDGGSATASDPDGVVSVAGRR